MNLFLIEGLLDLIQLGQQGCCNCKLLDTYLLAGIWRMIQTVTNATADMADRSLALNATTILLLRRVCQLTLQHIKMA